MKTKILILICLLPFALFAQKKALEELERARANRLPEITGVTDRAGGLINKGSIGEFFENRGKLYARRVTDGPSGEYPIGSGRDYIYRVNPFIGIPGNVVQGRFTTNEEWEAVGGYHNPVGARVAFSDRPESWPATGWPVKDADGNRIIRSDQDSYCVFSDSNNTKPRLGLVVAQTTYTYGVKFARDIIFFKYEITTKSSKKLDSLFFALYMDLDIGNLSGGVAEYEDDMANFNKELQMPYFYDSDNFSSEWVGAPPGYMGFPFVRTPVVNGMQLGVTDWHYGLYDDDIDVDSVQYGIMSSSAGLYRSTIGSRYFHLGANAPDLHFDDPKTIPATGLDILAWAGSGPYTLNPGDTLRFILAMVAGGDLNELLANTRTARKIESLDFQVARPPDLPRLSGVAGDRRVSLYWDNRSELSRDKFTNQFDFEGYKLYRSLDKGSTWDQIDRNAVKTAGPDPIPLVQFDKVDDAGKNTGLQYTFIDSTVLNGFEYWYSLTAYDKGDSTLESLETPIGSSLEVPNIVSLMPRQDAIGRTPPAVSGVTQTGTGNSDYRFVFSATDQPGSAGKNFSVEIAPYVSVEKGNLLTAFRSSVTNSAQTAAKDYAIRFLSNTTFDVLDLKTGAAVLSNQTYTSGMNLTFDGLTINIKDDDPAVAADFKPEARDSILISRGIRVLSGPDTVMALRKLLYSVPFATSNGVLFTVVPSSYIKSVTRTSGSDLVVTASAVNEAVIVADTYRLNVKSVNGSGSSMSINVEVRNAANVVVASRDSAKTGAQIDFQGVRATVSFATSTPPAANTTFEIATNIPKPISCKDKFSFSTTSASVDQQVVTSELSKIRVVPNPYVVSSKFEEEFGVLRREPIRQIKFIHLPQECTIYIFTLDGDVIQTLRHSSTNGVEPWDLRTSAGREIAPGVYLYLVKTDTAERLDRFAVIK